MHIFHCTSSILIVRIEMRLHKQNKKHFQNRIVLCLDWFVQHFPRKGKPNEWILRIHNKNNKTIITENWSRNECKYLDGINFCRVFRSFLHFDLICCVFFASFEASVQTESAIKFILIRKLIWNYGKQCVCCVSILVVNVEHFQTEWHLIELLYKKSGQRKRSAKWTIYPSKWNYSLLISLVCVRKFSLINQPARNAQHRINLNVLKIIQLHLFGVQCSLLSECG